MEFGQVDYKLVETINSHGSQPLCERKRVDIYILSLDLVQHKMCKSEYNCGDIPFPSIDNMTQLVNDILLDSTYLKVNGTYSKTKYILTCPQRIFF